MKYLLLMLGLLALASTVVSAQYNVGAKVDDFTLRDAEGKAVSFSSLKGDTTVVLFVSTRCPVSNAYNARMASLMKDYGAKGVKFVLINSNINESADEVAQHTKTNALVAVYKDADNVVADKFGATVTPEAFILDRNGVVQYHGSIDDAQNEAKINVRGARQALDALLAGRSVELSKTKAFGCTIKRKKAS